jgi:amino acid adenylation domain-containing protein
MPADIVDAYPLTRLQAGMLYHSQVEDRSGPTYHDISAIRLTGRFDEEALRAALAGVVARAEVLRTSVDLTGFSRPMQLVHAAAPTPLTVEDLRGLAEDEQRRRIDAWTAREKATGFDLSAAPLLRLHAHVLGDRDFRLNLAFHHAVLDGWSLSLVTADLLGGYDALLAGRRVEQPGPVTRFRDYLPLELEALADPEARAYWTRTLGDAEFTALPRDDGPGLAAERSARVYDVPLPDGCGGAVRAVAAQAGVSAKSVLFAAHARVLALLCGRGKIVTGRVSNGRPETADGDRAVGMFLNTLPLVVDTAGASWVELARRIHRAEAEALPYRRYPMAQLLRDLGRRELFESVVDHRSFRGYELALDQVRVADGEFFEQTDFPFTANFATDPATGAVSLRINFDAARFTPPRIAEIAGYYAAALADLAAHPDRRPRAADLLGPERVRSLLNAGTGPAEPVPDRILPELLAKRAAQQPDEVALRTEDAALTYAQLEGRADRLAQRLRELGVGPDVLVAVHQRRSAQLIISLLAVLKAGGAYVPLDPGYPADRLQYMVADSGAAVLLCDPGLEGALDPAGARVLPVGPDAAEDPSQQPAPARTTPPETTPDHLAYVIYTSGSTGRPKGVQITHGALVNLLRSFERELAFTDRDRLLAVTSLSFDIAALEVYLPLLAGAELLLAPDIAADGPRLRAYIEDRAPTVLQATPSSWQLLVDAGLRADPGLRAVSGGEALPAQLARRLTELFPSVWNAYGPTETTIWSCVQRLEPHGTVGLGTPIDNTHIYVLDGSCEPVPDGVPGELWIAGHGLARGYLGRPDLTADRFAPDPFAADGSRMYRTGDLVRRLGSGGLEFLGRADDQVKLHGFRIEPGEIEAVLAGHPAVGRAVVRVREDRPGDHRLVAYITAESGRLAVPGAAELRTLAATRLPDHMVPSAFVALDRFPLTPNGKIDRAALPAPGREQTAVGAYVAPSTASERLVAELWREVLGADRVGATDGFVELGGDSIAALRTVMRLSDLVESEVPVSVLFDGGTVRSVAAFLDGERRETGPGGGLLVPLHPAGSRTPLFFVHPLGGSALGYAALAAALPPDQPLHGVQAPEYAGDDVPRPQSVEQIAALYLAAIREVQPAGPYHLGGWCMGGMVAYEMSRQLQAGGEAVASLTIVSASIDEPVPERYTVSEAAAIIGAFDHRLPASEAELEALDPEERLRHVVRLTLGTTEERPDARSIDGLRRLVVLYQRHARALIAYRDAQRTPYRGDVLLIRAERELFSGWDFGWKRRVDGALIIDESPGDHYSMLEPPNVAKIAARLESALAGRPGGEPA